MFDSFYLNPVNVFYRALVFDFFTTDLATFLYSCLLLSSSVSTWNTRKAACTYPGFSERSSIENLAMAVKLIPPKKESSRGPNLIFVQQCSWYGWCFLGLSCAFPLQFVHCQARLHCMVLTVRKKNYRYINVRPSWSSDSYYRFRFRRDNRHGSSFRVIVIYAESIFLLPEANQELVRYLVLGSDVHLHNVYF